MAPSYLQLVYFYLIKQWIQKKMEEKLGGRGERFLPPWIFQVSDTLYPFHPNKRLVSV